MACVRTGELCHHVSIIRELEGVHADSQQQQRDGGQHGHSCHAHIDRGNSGGEDTGRCAVLKSTRSDRIGSASLVNESIRVESIGEWRRRREKGKEQRDRDVSGIIDGAAKTIAWDGEETKVAIKQLQLCIKIIL